MGRKYRRRRLRACCNGRAVGVSPNAMSVWLSARPSVRLSVSVSVSVSVSMSISSGLIFDLPSTCLVVCSMRCCCVLCCVVLRGAALCKVSPPFLLVRMALYYFVLGMRGQTCVSSTVPAGQAGRAGEGKERRGESKQGSQG